MSLPGLLRNRRPADPPRPRHPALLRWSTPRPGGTTAANVQSSATPRPKVFRSPAAPPPTSVGPMRTWQVRTISSCLPARSADDRTALRTAALDGTLDAVVSDHRPRTPEEHDADFMVVAGIAGLHAVGSALCGALRDHGASSEDVDEAMAGLLLPGLAERSDLRIGCRADSLPCSARRTRRRLHPPRHRIRSMERTLRDWAGTSSA